MADTIDGMDILENSLVYELDEREVYNDIRSEVNLPGTETVIDADPAYEWKMWSVTIGLPAPGYTTFRYFEAAMPNPLSWSLASVTATDSLGNPYHDYAISLIDTNEDNVKAVELTNTGASTGWIHFVVKYRYLVSEGESHEETVYTVSAVRAVDAVSGLRYGPRVMNLIWPEGATDAQMQAEVDAKLSWYKDAHPRLYLSVLGKDQTHRDFISAAEIDYAYEVICTELGLSAYFRLKELDVSGDLAGYPLAKLTLVGLRTEEGLYPFVLDSSLLDGADVLV